MSVDRTRLPNRQEVFEIPFEQRPDFLEPYYERTYKALIKIGVFSRNFERGIFPEGLSDAKIAELKITKPWQEISTYLLGKLSRMNSYLDQTFKFADVLTNESVSDERKLFLYRQNERALLSVLSSQNPYEIKKKEQAILPPSVSEHLETKPLEEPPTVEEVEAMPRKKLTVDNRDPEEPKILADGERITLEEEEEDLLVFLSREAGFWLSRSQIIKEILPSTTKASAVTELVDRLNKKLAEATGIDQVIESEKYRGGLDYLIDEKTIDLIITKKEDVKLPQAGPGQRSEETLVSPKIEVLELSEITPFTPEQAAQASVILRTEYLDVDGHLLSFKLPHEISEACKKIGNLLPAVVGVGFYNLRPQDYAAQRQLVLRSLYTVLYNPTSMAVFLDGGQKNKVELEIKGHLENIFTWFTQGKIASKSRLIEKLSQISPEAIKDEWELYRNPTLQKPEPAEDTQTLKRRDLEKNFLGLDKKVDAVIAEVITRDDLSGEIKLTALKDKFPEFESKSAVEWAIKFAKLIQPKKGVSGAAIITMVDLVAYLSVSRLYPSKNKRRNKTLKISQESGEIRSYIQEKINEVEEQELRKE